MAELKPCPFCGGEAKVQKDVHSIDGGLRLFYYVRCCLCGAIAGFKLECYPRQKEHKAKREAIDAWNRRADNG